MKNEKSVFHNNMCAIILISHDGWSPKRINKCYCVCVSHCIMFLPFEVYSAFGEYKCK